MIYTCTRCFDFFNELIIDQPADDFDTNDITYVAVMVYRKTINGINKVEWSNQV